MVLRTIAQAKAESEISQVGLWCKRIVNSYSDFDSEEKKSGFNLSAQLP